MDDPGPEDGSTEPRPSEGRAILLCSSTDTGARSQSCSDALVPEGTDAVDLLCVSFSGSPAPSPENLRARGVAVERYAVATVGSETGDLADLDRTFSVESIEAVDHLSDLGMYVRDVLEDWAEDDDETPSVVCFDSVDDLLVRADLELTFEFLLVLIEGIRPWSAIAHFHLGPEGHDGTTRRTLEHLFDDVIEAGDEPV